MGVEERNGYISGLPNLTGKMSVEPPPPPSKNSFRTTGRMLLDFRIEDNWLSITLNFLGITIPFSLTFFLG